MVMGIGQKKENPTEKRNGNRKSEICYEYGIRINPKKRISPYCIVLCCAGAVIDNFDRATHLKKSISVCVI